LHNSIKYPVGDINASHLPDTIIVNFDGLCQPKNPGGIACYAYVIKQAGKVVHQDYGIAAEPFSSNATNNVAEYTGLIRALEWLAANRDSLEPGPIRIIGDSQLVVGQISGRMKVRKAHLVPLYRKVLSLKEKLKDLSIELVGREENKEADSLTNRAYREFLKNNPQYAAQAGKHFATQKQLAFLKRYGVIVEDLSKIEASRMISKIIKGQKERGMRPD
jgi:ribonuclease HI